MMMEPRPSPPGVAVSGPAAGLLMPRPPHHTPPPPMSLPLPGTFPHLLRGFGLERLRHPMLPPTHVPPRPPPPPPQHTPPPPPHMSPAAAAAALMQQHGFPHHPGPATDEPAAFPDPRLFPPPPPMPPVSWPGPGLLFSAEDLDMVLYGYARSKLGDAVLPPGHALSGLRIGELSYGMDRILSGHHHHHPASSPGKHHHQAAAAAGAGPIDPSSLDLAEGVELFQTTFAGTVHYGIFCKKPLIPKGTRFGPFQGKMVNTSEIKTNDDNSFMWEIFLDGKLSHFVDGRGNAGNWMAYVNCARYAQEQNLTATQVDGQIYYEACKDIPQGTELLVWYGDLYLQFMGIPVALKEMGDGAAGGGLQAEEAQSKDSEGYTCERCGKVFAYKYYRDKHLKYTRCVDQGDRKFPCHLCTRSFEKRDRLRIHILHVHEKHRPHKCAVCGKSFSQSSSLNKHMRVHSGERPYKCVYCSKAFTASSILRTHIRQHSGEKPFKCRHCGKAFASHAAHDSHVRRTHAKERAAGGGGACGVCGKTFSQAYELKFHLKTHDAVGVGRGLLAPGDINMNDKLHQMDEPIDVVGDHGMVS